MNEKLEFPRREAYWNFMENFGSRIRNEFSDVCFYTYGSFNDPDIFNAGTADIDGGLILSSGVITIKKREETRQIAEILSEALIETGIDVDFNLLDRQTNQDGRFLSYSQSMTDHIKARGKVISGPAYYIDGLNGMNYRNEDLVHSAMNLRSLRNRLLFSAYDSQTNYKKFAEGVLSNIKKAVKFPKQLVLLKTRKLLTNPFDARKKLQEILCGIDLEEVNELNSILRNTGILTKSLRNRDKAIGLLEKSLDIVEYMVGEYLTVFPFADEKEVKGFQEDQYI